MTAIAAPTEPLWTRARAMFARAVAGVGAPAAIAAISFLNKTLRRDIIAWLAPLECIVRRLLLAEAAELRRTEREHAKRRLKLELVPLHSWTAGLRTRTSAVAKKGASEDARSKIDRARPETWCAQFSFALPRDTRLVSNAHAPRIRALWGAYTQPPETPPPIARARTTEHASFRLARRFEALRRVLEDPTPHAQRLARALASQARRVPRLVQRYVWTGPRADAFDPADHRLSLDALSAAFGAPEAFKDTS